MTRTSILKKSLNTLSIGKDKTSGRFLKLVGKVPSSPQKRIEKV